MQTTPASRAEALRFSRRWLSAGGLKATRLSTAANAAWWAVASSALSPVILTSGWLVAGAVQAPSYSPVRETVSVMAGYDGADRWIMTSAMLAAGLCYLVTAAGLPGLRPAARSGLLLAGISAIGVATSPEPASGPGPVHIAWTVIGAASIAIWPAIAGWRNLPPWTLASPRAVIAATALFLALLGWVLLEVHGGDALGAAERASATIPTVWPFVVAVALRRRSGQAAGNVCPEPQQHERAPARELGSRWAGRWLSRCASLVLPLRRPQQRAGAPASRAGQADWKAA